MFRFWPGRCSLFRVASSGELTATLGFFFVRTATARNLPLRVLLKTKRSAIDSMVASRSNCNCLRRFDPH
jgi:hypothetical protein